LYALSQPKVGCQCSSGWMGPEAAAIMHRVYACKATSICEYFPSMAHSVLTCTQQTCEQGQIGDLQRPVAFSVALATQVVPNLEHIPPHASCTIPQRRAPPRPLPENHSGDRLLATASMRATATLTDGSRSSKLGPGADKRGAAAVADATARSTIRAKKMASMSSLPHTTRAACIKEEEITAVNVPNLLLQAILCGFYCTLLVHASVAF